MGKDLLLSLGGDVEEGEISDSASVEEISAEDFSSKPPALRSEIKSEITASKNASIDESKQQQQSQKVWTMQDLVKYQKKYQMSRNYAPGLYNFAWAQAVQNKPLEDYLTTMNNSNTTDNNSKQSNNDDDNKIVMDITGDDADSEKEEGELEEGEIDLDMEVLNKQGEGDDLDKRIDVIRIGLEGITLNDAKNSFVGVCSRFEDSMDSLSTLLSETSVSNKDDLVQLAFSAIQLVHSVFCGMSQSQKEQCRHLISRMLNNVKGYMPVMLSPEQLKEIDNMIMSSTTEESVLDPIRIETQDQNANQSEPLKTQTSISKNRVLLPLLDLHKDHDLDSLPSPTRETTNSLPLGKGPFVDNTAIRPEWPTPRAVIHRYETDALKAVSTYQQKFGKSSFFSSDLPSPTPSEDSGGDAGGDTGGEISSFSTESEKREIFSSPHVERNNTQLFSNARTAAPVYSTSSSVTRFSNKTRDPRLRLANSDNFSDSVKQPTIEPFDVLSGLRKQKSLDDSVSVDGPAPKRLKNEFSDSVSLRNIGSVTVTQNRGIETGVTTSSLPSTSSGSVHIPVTGVSATSASLQSILKDIAVNPAQWMNLINMEQQKSVDPSKSVTQSLSQNSFMGSMPMSATVSQPLVVGQRSTTEMQTPQIASSDDSAKVRMKPRDPRRALHNKSLQKTEQNTNVTNTEGNKVKSKKLDPRISPQPNSATDITRQFTKNLKNIADIVSTTVSSSTQIPSSQSAQAHSSYVNIKGLSSQTGRVQNGPTSEEGSAGQSQSNNTWENVEQYFGRFDDQQRAAIQRERTKRMEEQKKMFADFKLCLVLDLDHTLLNSAKFCEIEPVHDEILRKKEQEDRDKPYRHLFRFPHMGMWTKLRPGIWNFLEKASKLFELHLYTMGNKVYATEMAKLLDPKGVLFSGRVISKGDDGDSVDGEPKSKDLEGVLGMESAVVIIDDSVRVWPHNKLNLIAVERYIYFPCSRRQFGLPGPSLLEIDHGPEDGTLASSLAVIEKIHRNFFMEKCLDEADVRNILASEQRKILGGCRIVFSRVFPVGEAAPHMHPLWQTAQQFGAVCTNQIDEHVTHVVANSLGTDKVNWALATGRPVVHPGWVEASALLYRRANEHDFAVQP